MSALLPHHPTIAFAVDRNGQPLFQRFGTTIVSRVALSSGRKVALGKIHPVN